MNTRVIDLNIGIWIQTSNVNASLYIHVHGLKHREARLHGSKILPEALPESSQIAIVQCNGDGTRVGIIVEQVWVIQVYTWNYNHTEYFVEHYYYNIDFSKQCHTVRWLPTVMHVW